MLGSGSHRRARRSRLGPDARRVVARGDEELRGDVAGQALFRDQLWHGGMDEFVEVVVVGGDLVGEVQSAAGQGSDRTAGDAGHGGRVVAGAGPPLRSASCSYERGQAAEFVAGPLGCGHDQAGHLIGGLGAGLDR